MDLESTAVWAAQVACMRAAVRQKYGDELARWFGATHVCVDPDRVTHPVSGTGCRADLAGHWAQLDEPERSGLATHIVVLGAESTGTMTVSCALAQRYRDRGGVWART